MISDIIAAVSTPPGRGGVAVVRLSGAGALGIAEKMFAPSGRTPVRGFEPYRMYPGSADCGAFRDFGLCVYFKAPHSFTGEDVVEFHCHGGTAITRGILKRAVSLGARLAERGEFTKRAFLNGKLSLASAEGLVDMINGESDAQVRAGYMLYSERLTGKVRTLQGELTEILAGIDADIDFPEEDIEHTDLKDVHEKIDHIAGELAALSATYGVGKKVKEGVSVVLAGRPNTGKSSVLNALLGADKAIVSSVAASAARTPSSRAPTSCSLFSIPPRRSRRRTRRCTRRFRAKSGWSCTTKPPFPTSERAMRLSLRTSAFRQRRAKISRFCAKKCLNCAWKGTIRTRSSSSRSGTTTPFPARKGRCGRLWNCAAPCRSIYWGFI